MTQRFATQFISNSQCPMRSARTSYEDFTFDDKIWKLLGILLVAHDASTLSLMVRTEPALPIANNAEIALWNVFEQRLKDDDE